MAGHEVERKWLVSDIPADAAGAPAETIDQGYLVVGERGSEVRLRRRAQRLSLTVKSGLGLVRDEHEITLDDEQFASLWPATVGCRVHKTRRQLDGGEGLVIELDTYTGALEGLLVAEVEFPDVTAAAAFATPAWFGREVTDDDAYKNRRLALDGRPAG